MKTYTAKPTEIQRQWFIVDAAGKTLGRLASQIAIRLRGKHKAIYSPHQDTGDYIVVINAEKVRVTGKKLEDKVYYHHSEYPGGIKSISLGDLLKKRPRKVLEIAVKGMLPKNSLGRAIYRKLKVYEGNKHPHAAQQPELLEMAEE